MQVFLFRDDQQVGPFSAEDLVAAVENGEVAADEYAWREGLQEWVPLRQIVTFPANDASKQLSGPPPLPTSRGKADQRENSADVQRLIGEEQDPAVVARLLSRVASLLTRDEQVVYIGAQKKPIVTLSPDAVVLTNRRFMIVRPKLLGMTFEDYQWREVVDVHMSEHMLSATISCRLVNGYVSRIDHIPKQQARRIYAYAQEVEEQMHIARRNAELETRRASAGGVIVQAPPQVNGAFVSNDRQSDAVTALASLKTMAERGLITEEEYASKRAEILQRM